MSPRIPAAASAALTALATLAACTSADSTGAGSTSAGSRNADATHTRTSDPTQTAPSATPRRLFVEASSAPLAAGTYQLSFFADPGVETPDALVTIPSGYEHETVWYVVSHDRGEFLGLWTVGQVDRDACLHGEEDSFDPGPTVKDMADALVAQKSTRASAPEPVTLAGHRGLYVEVSSPRDLGRCDEEAGLWNDPGGRGIYGAGQVDRVWILDVDGQRLVVDAAYSARSTASDRNDLTAMVESLELVAAAPN